MSTSNDSFLFRGPPAWCARTRQGPLAALLAGGLILIAAIGAGLLALQPLAVVLGDPSGGGPPSTTAVLAAQLVIQLVTVALVLVAADRGRKADMLALVPPAGGLWPALIKGLSAVLLVTGVYTLLVLWLRPEDLIRDLRPLWEMMRSPDWWLLALVAGIGAPLSEEILFRGYLQTALAQTPLGFVGAALLTNAGWTAMHAGYTTTGLVEVFLVGLVFSWLLWRTGSLWVPILAHGIYNSLIVLVMSQLPVPA